MKKPLITIIVPVYQAETYLSITLDTILAQTYSDFEVILVDDGSSDQSPEICDRYARMDQRIIVYHNENQGASEARNFGILHAQGKYLAFVDSDDLLEPDFLEVMITAFETQEIDLALCGFDKFYQDDPTNKLEYLLGTKEKEVLNSNRDLCRLFTVPKTSLSGVSIWAKMYKTKIIRENNLHFPPDVSYEEDCCFNLQYYRHVQKAATFQKSMYHYRQQLESLSKTYKPTTYADLVNGYNERVRFAKELNMPPDTIKKLNSVFLIVTFNNFKKIVKSPLRARSRWMEYKRILDFKEAEYVLNECGLSKVRMTRYLTIASRKRWILAIDVLLLYWKWRNQEH